jgi:hypothetical protein
VGIHSDQAGHEMPRVGQGRYVHTCLPHSIPSHTVQHCAVDGAERRREKKGKGSLERGRTVIRTT